MGEEKSFLGHLSIPAEEDLCVPKPQRPLWRLSVTAGSMSSTKLHFCPIRYAKACVQSPEKSCHPVYPN